MVTLKGTAQGRGSCVFECPFSVLGQVSAWQPDRVSRTTLQSHPSVIFLVYRQLVQGKLRFLFHDLAKDFCREGSQRVPEPPSTPCPQLPQGDSESPAS